MFSEVDGFVELGDLRFQLLASDDLKVRSPAVRKTDFIVPETDSSPTLMIEKHRIPLVREGKEGRYHRLLVQP